MHVCVTIYLCVGVRELCIRVPQGPRFVPHSQHLHLCIINTLVSSRWLLNIKIQWPKRCKVNCVQCLPAQKGCGLNQIACALCNVDASVLSLSGLRHKIELLRSCDIHWWLQSELKWKCVWKATVIFYRLWIFSIVIHTSTTTSVTISSHRIASQSISTCMRPEAWLHFVWL